MLALLLFIGASRTDSVFSATRKQSVYNAFCIPDGIGAWFERNQLPIFFALHCPTFRAVYKRCDFIATGHGGRRYDDLFGVYVNQQLINDFERRRAQHASDVVEISFDYRAPWLSQIDAVDCDRYRHAKAVVFAHPPHFGYAYDRSMQLAETLSFKNNERIALRSPFVVRIAMHYRAGDVFTGYLDKPDMRSIPFKKLEEIVEATRRVFALLNKIDVIYYMITELPTRVAIDVMDRLPGVNILWNSADETAHMALVRECDVLVLGFSAFSWLLAILNPHALKIVYPPTLEKYRHFNNVVYHDGVQNYSGVLGELVRKKLLQQ